MNVHRFLTLALLLLPTFARAAEPDKEGFRPLFNEKDLAGWVLVNTAPSTWTVKDKMLICSGKPIGEIRTDRMYQNFILELEWRHLVPKGNAGVFVWADDITARGVPFHRSIEVQVLENAYGNTRGYTTHGDIFPIHGAKMTPLNGRGGSRAFPTENRSNPSPEWNHYRIVCQDGEISLAVNGKVVTRGKECSPRKGYICLESEGGIVHYRNLRIKELLGKSVAKEHVAIANRGYRTLYNGIDLSGWSGGKETHWQSRDWVLFHDGKGEGLMTEQKFGDAGFVFDVKLNKNTKSARVQLRDKAVIEISPSKQTPVGRWHRFEGKIVGDRLTVSLNDQPLKDETIKGIGDGGRLQLSSDGPVEFANLYIQTGSNE